MPEDADRLDVEGVRMFHFGGPTRTVIWCHLLFVLAYGMSRNASRRDAWISEKAPWFSISIQALVSDIAAERGCQVEELGFSFVGETSISDLCTLLLKP